MSATDRFPIRPDEMEPIALWFRVTLDNARKLRERQDHGGAAFLINGCRRVFRSMREHGTEHGYSPDLLFADIRNELEAASVV